jgi:hypothetical protein
VNFFTPEKLGQTRELTPEGYLLCRSTPIARIGTMLYLPQEIGKQAGPDGIVRVLRSEAEVFNPESVDSMNGKSITVNHPPEDVSPDNWRTLTVGTVSNTRRGEGDQANLLVADLLITDSYAISLVQKNEDLQLSAGYDAKYDQTTPGEATQSRIRYNHLALLPNTEGRCGSICSIGDRSPFVLLPDEDKRRVKTSLKDRLMAAIKRTIDEAPEDKPADEPKADEPKPEETKDEEQDPIAALCARVDALEAALAKLAAPTTDEDPAAEEKKDDEPKPETQDENPLPEMSEEEKQLTVDAASVFARAEILSPGIALPTRDAKADPKTFRDSLCALKRKALDAAFTNTKTRDAIAPLLAGVDLAKLPCAALHATFVGASELVKRENNSAIVVRDAATVTAPATTNLIDSLNQQYKDFWSRQ